jgi:inner membrane protein
MDNLTHSLFGLALARSGLAERAGPGATALLVVASNIPDVDAILLFTDGADAAWLRRTHTHCLLGASVLALVLGLAWWAAGRRRMALPHALGLAFLGVLGHVGMDLLNSYGVVALWPFSHERFELAWVFIIDLAMLAILIAPLLLARPLSGRVSATTLSRAALVALAAYISCCGLARAHASAILADLLAREGARPTLTYVFPEALGPHR